ncbi:MAG: hypothetical protein M0036_18060 [Desulfobacteraceae bacterium]|nr:hypothetical protein [Desulfobacteraceae bacterium]
MNEIDDLELKAEIDQISKRIDAIVQQVEKLDPAAKENPSVDHE